jgi:hypothetical protein
MRPCSLQRDGPNGVQDAVLRQAEKQPAASAGTSRRAHDGDSDSRRGAEIGANDVGKARVAGTTKEQRAAKV